MLGYIRKAYKHFKNNRKKIQSMCEEIDKLREEMIKLKEDNLNIKMLISRNNTISNPCYDIENEHTYEEINYDEVVVPKEFFSSNISPQLPQRNKINSIEN